jgi:hypothetical protein
MACSTGSPAACDARRVDSDGQEASAGVQGAAAPGRQRAAARNSPAAVRPAAIRWASRAGGVTPQRCFPFT